jgi:UMF1 family MFS transporter
MGEFFGLFALSGNLTAFFGPVLVGFATYFSGSQRVGMASLLILLLVGLSGMFFVHENRTSEAQ